MVSTTQIEGGVTARIAIEQCIIVKAFKTGRRNYEVWASFFSADSRKIGKVMVKVVPESTLLLT